jgi:hypothetical protein
MDREPFDLPGLRVVIEHDIFVAIRDDLGCLFCLGYVDF